MGKLSPYLKPPHDTSWTGTAPLPGGDMEGGDFDRFLSALRGKYPWLAAETATRLARAYGTRAERILGNAQSVSGLGIDFGAGLFQAEIDYLIGQEFALTPEDILWRRSKLYLHLSGDQIAAVGSYVKSRTRTSEHPNA